MARTSFEVTYGPTDETRIPDCLAEGVALLMDLLQRGVESRADRSKGSALSLVSRPGLTLLRGGMIPVRSPASQRAKSVFLPVERSSWSALSA